MLNLKAQNGLLLSSEGYDNGTDITTTTNRGEAHQTWSILNNTDNSSYRLKNFRSELVMCVWSGSKDENAKIRSIQIQRRLTSHGDWI